MSEDYGKYIEKYKDIFDYIKDYHTSELVDLMIQKRGNKKDAAKVAAAIAVRNGLKTIDPHTAYHAVRHHTDYLIEKTQKRLNDTSLSEREKKHKIACYCAAIAMRNGLKDDLPIIINIAFKVLKHI
ncbi:MAG: hypothetical protein E7496_11685 [Ruminococcus sp.]|nr:hypothetical protein [Ruminococcus sp.]